MRRFRMALSILFALTACLAAYGQVPGNARVEQGVRLFGEEKYSEALEIFNRVLADTGAVESRPDAVYWSGLSYIALGNLENARRSLDVFIKEYPRDGHYPDAVYQRGRISYMQGDYEEGIRIFGAFLDANPGHSFFPSALFWTGDCLFSIGRLSEAESIFRAILDEYPDSVKYEAANYKLSLIRLKYRERELLTLLKWSHEESLRVIEEFQRREKAYEQALSVYQRRLSEAGLSQGEKTPAPSAQKDTGGDVAALNARIEELSRLLEAETGSAVPSQGKESLLGLKAEALELMSYYLDWLARNGGMEVQP